MLFIFTQTINVIRNWTLDHKHPRKYNEVGEIYLFDIKRYFHKASKIDVGETEKQGENTEKIVQKLQEDLVKAKTDLAEADREVSPYLYRDSNLVVREKDQRLFLLK
jgi:hypothetical protein